MVADLVLLMVTSLLCRSLDGKDCQWFGEQIIGFDDLKSVLETAHDRSMSRERARDPERRLWRGPALAGVSMVSTPSDEERAAIRWACAARAMRRLTDEFETLVPWLCLTRHSVDDVTELRDLSVSIIAQGGVLLRRFGWFDDREVGVGCILDRDRYSTLRWQHETND